MKLAWGDLIKVKNYRDIDKIIDILLENGNKLSKNEIYSKYIKKFPEEYGKPTKKETIYRRINEWLDIDSNFNDNPIVFEIDKNKKIKINIDVLLKNIDKFNINLSHFERKEYFIDFNESNNISEARKNNGRDQGSVRKAKKWFYEEGGNCDRCKKSQMELWNGKFEFIELHHKKRFSENKIRRRFTTLKELREYVEFLCPNCHTKADFENDNNIE